MAWQARRHRRYADASSQEAAPDDAPPAEEATGRPDVVAQRFSVKASNAPCAAMWQRLAVRWPSSTTFRRRRVSPQGHDL